MTAVTPLHPRGADVGRPPIILMHIVWMPSYQSEKEPIYAGGFRYPKEEGWAHEMLNFKAEGGRIYGHVEMKDRQIHVEKLGADRNADSVDGVLVVWTAPSPSGKGHTIVGWYKNATIHRWRQMPTGRLAEVRTHNGEVWDYRVEAAAEDCTLLPEERRVLTVPQGERGQKGVPGRSPLFYLSLQGTPEATALEQRIRTFIDTGRLPPTPRPRPGHIQPDIKRRQKIETAAMEAVQAHFRGLDYDVNDVSAENLGYDLLATCGDEVLCIEVKGRSGTDVIADFTFNEYDQIKLEERRKFPDGSYRICIVTDALNEGPGAELHHFSCWPVSSTQGEWRRVGGDGILALTAREAARGVLTEEE